MTRDGRTARVLVCEDDDRVRTTLLRILRAEGLEVVAAADGREALDLLAAEPVEAVVLDIGLPHVDGVTITRRLRAAGDGTAILMLTARDAVEDRVDALDAGADDYVTKPFDLRELLARLRALLRRVDRTPPATTTYADLVFDAARQVVVRAGREAPLTRTEAALLRLFLQHPEEVLTRSRLYEVVWGYDFGASSNTLGVFVGYLRRKTEVDGRPRLLHTVRGVGYVLREGRP